MKSTIPIIWYVPAAAASPVTGGGRARHPHIARTGAEQSVCVESRSARHASRAMPMQQPDSAGKGVLKRIIGTNSDSKTTLFLFIIIHTRPPRGMQCDMPPGVSPSSVGHLNVCLRPGLV